MCVFIMHVNVCDVGTEAQKKSPEDKLQGKTEQASTFSLWADVN